jgi:hypothetical protein
MGKTEVAKIQFRRGTAASWTSANPVLLNGEPGYETDTKKYKIGDGVTAWTSLAYVTSGGGGSSDWADITNKPSTFTPSAHSHVISDVTGLQTALDGKQATLVSGTNIKTVNGETLLGSGNLVISGGGGHGGHTSWGDIDGTLSNQTDLQNALNGKEGTITAGTTSQYYRGDKTFQTLDKAAVGLSNVDNTTDANKPVSTATQTALNAKANTSHSHIIGDVTGLQTALDGKQASGSYAAASHSHIIADVTGLQTALDGKQASGSYAAASHTHVIGDTTGLQTALDGKQKTITSGTAAPSGGADGDIYLQYT